MFEQLDVGATGGRIEELLAELRSSPDTAAAGRADELVRCLLDLYGRGLARVVELTGEGGAAGSSGSTGSGGDVLGRLVADPLVGSLLVLHGLHPEPVEARIEGALAAVRPYLGSHAGGIEYLGLADDGVVHLRLEGTCHGCPSSLVTVKSAIERAVLAAAPEVVGVDVEGVAEPAAVGFIPIERVGLRCPTELATAAR